MSKLYSYFGSFSSAAPSCYYAFDGVNEYIQVGGVSDFSYINSTAVFTISFYIRLKDYTANNIQRLIGNNGTASAKRGFQIEYRNNSNEGVLRMNISNGSSFTIVSTSTNNIINDNDWHSVIISGDGSNIRFEVDNVSQVGSSSIGTLSVGNATHILAFAKINNIAQYSYADLDEISFYTSNLSAANKTAIFDATRIAPDYSSIPTLVNHYKMGEDDTWDGSNWTVIDSVSAVNGASVNMEEVDRICS